MQVKDQIWEKGNQALRVSCEKKLPVRVMRGSKTDGKLQYVYDGLYMVKEFKTEVRLKDFMFHPKSMGLPVFHVPPCDIPKPRPCRPRHAVPLSSSFLWRACLRRAGHR